MLISAVAAPSKVTNAYHRIHKHLNDGIEQCMDISPYNILQPSPSPYSINDDFFTTDKQPGSGDHLPNNKINAAYGVTIVKDGENIATGQTVSAE